MNRLGLLLVGGGGHALSCIDVVEAEGVYQIDGLVDAALEQGVHLLGYPVLGGDVELERLAGSIKRAIVAVGHIKSPDTRIRLYKRLQALEYTLPIVVSPFARVSPHAKLGAGTIVMHGAIINAGAEVGENCIVNTRAVVEHGARVSDHCHIATGVLLNGGVSVGEGSFVGSGSHLKEGVRIGRRCCVAMGTAVFDDLADGMLLSQRR